MGCLRPELLLLLLPVLALWWKCRGGRGPTPALRLGAALLLVLALAEPYRELGGAGRDLIVLVDRSSSMPAASGERALEWIELAQDARGSGDRVGVVSFGRAAQIESLPSEQGRFAGFSRAVDGEASNLGLGLERALALIPTGRPGSVLVLSDGLSNGGEALAAARAAWARGVQVHTLLLERQGADELCVSELELPSEVMPGEPFQLAAWVESESFTRAEVTLEREGELLATQLVELEPGVTRVPFRDRLLRGGVQSYRVRARLLDAQGLPRVDAITENDQALGALRVGGPRRLLLINDDGQADALSELLRVAGVAVDVHPPEQAPLTRTQLAAFSAVVLENVAARRLGAGLDALEEFVRERGGGLLLSGGRASFGLGGYHLSAIDRLLPVSMELRQEWRKQGVAICFALDRSGSMSAGVGGGLTKMDLANQGTIASLSLLSGMDSAAVLAVDTTAHQVVPLVAADNPGELSSLVRGIASEGGGIFVYAALAAAWKQLEDAPQLNKHIVLFADAADSEQPEGVVELLERLHREQGLTVSVIALGSETDSDALFLKQVALAGGGELNFTADPRELPQIFARDTMLVARASFVEEPTLAQPLPALFALTDRPPQSAAAVAGYNLTWARAGSSIGLVTDDDYHAPLLAWRPLGLGRSASLMLALDAQLVAWPEAGELLVSTLRWLLGPSEPAGLFSRSRREGAQAQVTLEVDSAASALPDLAGARARLSAPSGALQEVPLQRLDAERYAAQLELAEPGVYLGEIALADGSVLALAPLALPYSPELERSSAPGAGRELLLRLAREGGGQPSVLAADLFAGAEPSRAWRSLAPWCAGLALLLVLLEIAGRRLALWGALRWPRWWPLRLRRAVRASRAPDGAAGAGPSSETVVAASLRAAAAVAQAATAEARAELPEAAAAAPQTDLGDALTRARERARRELGR